MLFSGFELRAGMVFCEAKRASSSQQQNSSLGNFSKIKSISLILNNIFIVQLPSI
jgi:hypothetical protein